MESFQAQGCKGRAILLNEPMTNLSRETKTETKWEFLGIAI